MGHSEPLGNREKMNGGVRDGSGRERQRRRGICGRRRCCWLFWHSLMSSWPIRGADGSSSQTGEKEPVSEIPFVMRV